MSSSLQTEASNKSYDNRISLITKLLELALDLGHQGLLEPTCAAVVKSMDKMSGTYGGAINRSLQVSLTLRDCAAIDEKSHEIESLRAALEKRLEHLIRGEQRHELRGKRKVNTLLHRARQARLCARAMVEVNAALMRW